MFPTLVALLNSGPVSLNTTAIVTCGEIVQADQGGLVFLVGNSGSAPLVTIVFFCSLQAELTFSAGDIITVFGSMDDDGFYYVSIGIGKVLWLHLKSLESIKWQDSRN